MPIDNRDGLEDTPLTIQIPIIDHCRRCGIPIQSSKRRTNLWCKRCRKYVDAELNGGQEHPLDFYFEHYKSWNNNAKCVEN